MRTAFVITTPDQSRIHVETDGGGDAIFLIPGLAGAAAFWRPVSNLLRDRFRVISMDHRGTNQSTMHEENHSVADLASDVIAVLDKFNLGRAHVVGHSTGGLVAQTLALDYPERISRIVLSGTWARPDYHFRQLFEVRIAFLKAGRSDLYRRLANVLGYPASWLNDHEIELERSIASVDVASRSATERRIQMLLEFDRSKELKGIKVPTLIVSATDDCIVPFHHALMLKELVHDATLIEMEGGHFFPKVSSDRYARILTEFLPVD